MVRNRLHGGDAVAARRLNLKQLMFLGLGGLLLRNSLLFTQNDSGHCGSGVAWMHGWGYAFYSMLGAYFVDRAAASALAGWPQSLVTFLTSGPAVLVGTFLVGHTVDGTCCAGGVIDWSAVCSCRWWAT